LIWNHVKGFTEAEAWGEPGRMNGLLLMLMTALRAEFRCEDPTAQFIIHNGFATSGHSEKSQHYVGNATDFHIESIVPFTEQVELVEGILKDLQVAHVVGLGIYPTWRHRGFHLDVRGRHSRWGFLGEQMVSFAEALYHARMD